MSHHAAVVFTSSFLAACAVLTPKPTSRTDEYIAANNVSGLRAVCAGNYTSVSEADRQRACDEVAARDGASANQIASVPCEDFLPRPGEAKSGGPMLRLKLAEVPKASLVDRLTQCGHFEMMLGEYFSLTLSEVAPAFKDGAGDRYLAHAVTKSDRQGKAAMMLVVDHLDPQAQSRAHADLLAAQPHLGRYHEVLGYLIKARHPKAFDLLPGFLDSEAPGDRVAGCKAARLLAAKTMHPRVDRLAKRDAHAVRVDGAVTWPVRTACQGAIEATK
jgi:hypothetical protein